jgi:hypothetical protein
MLAGVLVPIAAFAATFAIIYILVTARNRERMGMIEKGIDPKDFLAKNKPSVYGILKWALLLVGIGLGLFLASLVQAYTTLPEEPAYFAGALFFGGLGLTAAFLITKKGESSS